MNKAFVITATDTDVGKTVFAAALTAALNGIYWKPVQSGNGAGIVGGTDREMVTGLIKGSAGATLPEVYLLTQPLSPHHSAELDGVVIDPAKLALPQVGRPLIVEGAGGLMVPLTRKHLYIDQFKSWNLPVILCARTGLGTINHTLLSLEALARRSIPLHGLVFLGDAMAETQRIIAEISGARMLGRLPKLPVLNAQTLQAAFAANFNLADFQ